MLRLHFEQAVGGKQHFLLFRKRRPTTDLSTLRSLMCACGCGCGCVSHTDTQTHKHTNTHTHTHTHTHTFPHTFPHTSCVDVVRGVSGCVFVLTSFGFNDEERSSAVRKKLGRQRHIRILTTAM
jgi:hypothetical protein